MFHLYYPGENIFIRNIRKKLSCLEVNIFFPHACDFHQFLAMRGKKLTLNVPRTPVQPRLFGDGPAIGANEVEAIVHQGPRSL